MRWIGKVVKWSILLVLIAFGLFWPLIFKGESSGSPPSDPVTIVNYKADYTVDKQGLLTATETITADFPGGRHGIFRYWDVANQNDSGVRQVPTVSSVRMDGAPIPVQYSWKNGSKNTAGGAMRLVSSQKNRCLSPRKR